MAGFEFFERDLRLATASLEPAQINAALAKFARSEVAKAVSAGASPRYEKFINGREGAAEETVKTPGPIVYVFTNWPIVINTAIDELKKRIHSKSGRYAGSFIAIVNGRVVTDYKAIAPTAEVIIVNFQPYSRRLDTSQKGTRNRRHFLGATNALMRRFGEVFHARSIYLDIGAGVHPMIPYVRRSSGRRKDRQAGMPISYPAIVINAL